MSTETDRKTRAAALVGIALVIALLGVVASSLTLGLDTCGGDGGAPYAAPDSPQGETCDDLNGPVGYLIVGGVPLALLAIAIWLIARWRVGRIPVPVVIVAVLAAPAWSLAVAVAAGGRSDVCSSEAQMAYDDWNDAARDYGMAHPGQAYPIPPPNNCGHY